MSAKEIASALEALKTEDIKNGWTHRVTNGDKTFGLNLSTVQRFSKDLKKDACLADELYSGNNHDLKVLATFIDDPDSYTQDELSARANQLYPSPFAEKFCEQIVAKSQFAVLFTDLWRNDPDNDKRCYAYYTLSAIAKQKNNLGVEFFIDHIKAIAKSIKKEPRKVRKAMYKALISIGCRDQFLRDQSMAAAQKVGLIRLDGSSSIDLLSQIKKTTEQRRPVFG